MTQRCVIFNDQSYKFEMLPGETYLGFPIKIYSVNGMDMTLENTMGDSCDIHAHLHTVDKHADCFVFMDMTGHVIAEYVLFEPEFVEPESENAFAYLRKAWRYTDRG